MDLLSFQAKSTIYVVRTYISINSSRDFSKMLEFVETYINTQMDNFDIDFDDSVSWITEAEEYDPC